MSEELIATVSALLPAQIATMSFWGVIKIWILSNFSTFLNWALLAVLIPIFTPIIAYLTLWIKSEFDQKVFLTSLKNVKEIVKVTVAESNQKYITKFPGGTNMPEEVKAKAFKDSFDKTMLFMSALDKQTLSARISDLNSFITSLIESEVLAQGQSIDFSKVS